MRGRRDAERNVPAAGGIRHGPDGDSNEGGHRTRNRLAMVVASIAAGTVVTVAWDSLTPHLPPVIAERDAILPALVASLICLFAVSLATKRPSEQQLAPFAS